MIRILLIVRISDLIKKGLRLLDKEDFPSTFNNIRISNLIKKGLRPEYRSLVTITILLLE